MMQKNGREIRRDYIAKGFIDPSGFFPRLGPKLNLRELSDRGFHYAVATRLGSNVPNLYMAGKL